MYKLEMHAHCAPVSACASAKPETVIARYRVAGYDGLVSTNHINGSTFRNMEEASWAEKIAFFMTGYRALRAAAGDDLDVLLGCEINLNGSVNDYLVYGVTEDWLLALGDPRDFSLETLSERVRAAGLLLVQAHPFRYGSRLMNERLLDGVEVYNAHRNHDSHNFLAQLWAQERGLLRTAGSDFHDPDSHIGGGILTRERISDNAALLRTLRGGDYELIMQ